MPRIRPAVVLFTCLFAGQAVVLVLSPILPDVAAEFGMSSSAAAQLRSVSGLTAGVVAVVLAVRGRRIRLVSLLHVGLVLLAVASLVSAVAPEFWVLIGSHAVIGLALAFVVSGALAASEAWAAPGTSTRVLSWALVGQPVSWIVGQPVVGLVADIDWRWAWIAVPLLSSLAALTVVALRDRGPERAVGGAEPTGLWRRSGVRAWAVSELLAFSAWGGTLVYAGAFFVEVHGATAGVTGIVLGIGATIYLPGNFMSRSWLERGSPAGPLGFFGATTAVAAIAFGAIRPGIVVSAVLFSTLAFFSAGRTIAGAAFGLRLADGRRLAAMSVRTSMQQFGYLVGSVTGGIVLSAFGYTGLGITFAVFWLSSLVLAVPAARSAIDVPTDS